MLYRNINAGILYVVIRKSSTKTVSECDNSDIGTTSTQSRILNSSFKESSKSMSFVSVILKNRTTLSTEGFSSFCKAYNFCNVLFIFRAFQAPSEYVLISSKIYDCISQFIRVWDRF